MPLIAGRPESVDTQGASSVCLSAYAQTIKARGPTAHAVGPLILIARSKLLRKETMGRLGRHRGV